MDCRDWICPCCQQITKGSYSSCGNCQTAKPDHVNPALDWYCVNPKCKTPNQAKKGEHCWDCRKPRPHLPGDWICKCKQFNFLHRIKCISCKTIRNNKQLTYNLHNSHNTLPRWAKTSDMVCPWEHPKSKTKCKAFVPALQNVCRCCKWTRPGKDFERSLKHTPVDNIVQAASFWGLPQSTKDWNRQQPKVPYISWACPRPSCKEKGKQVFWWQSNCDECNTRKPWNADKNAAGWHCHSCNHLNDPSAEAIVKCSSCNTQQKQFIPYWKCTAQRRDLSHPDIIVTCNQENTGMECTSCKADRPMLEGDWYCNQDGCTEVNPQNAQTCSICNNTYDEIKSIKLQADDLICPGVYKGRPCLLKGF